jgi:cytochrome P450
MPKADHFVVSISSLAIFPDHALDSDRKHRFWIHILTHRRHRKAEDALGPIVGSNAIAAANGPVWKQLHHTMAPAFSTSHVRTQVGLMTAETRLFCDRLKDLSRSKTIFSMEVEISKLVFDIVGRIVFDFPLHAQTKGSTWYVYIT